LETVEIVVLWRKHDVLYIAVVEAQSDFVFCNGSSTWTKEGEQKGRMHQMYSLYLSEAIEEISSLNLTILQTKHLP